VLLELLVLLSGAQGQGQGERGGERTGAWREKQRRKRKLENIMGK
jgi:hypothetical protein